jgi:hypothetical protein
MDEPPYTCETSEIMNKLDMGEIPETPAKEQGYGPLDAAACSLTVDQMADALGLYACDFWVKHPQDCDVCSDAKEGEMIWVMMAGAYPGSTQEVEYYACSECVAIKHAAAFSSENDSGVASAPKDSAS